MKKRRSSEPRLSEIKDYDALESIWSALEAKPELLASRLRDGSASPEERKMAAGIIEGKIKPRRLRPGESSRHKRLAIAERVAFVEKLLPIMRRKAGSTRPVFRSKESIPSAAEEYGVKLRHAYAAWAEFKDDLAHVDRMYPNSFARFEHTPELAEINPEGSKRVREALKNTGPDILVQIIEGLLAQARVARGESPEPVSPPWKLVE